MLAKDTSYHNIQSVPWALYNLTHKEGRNIAQHDFYHPSVILEHGLTFLYISLLFCSPAFILF